MKNLKPLLLTTALIALSGTAFSQTPVRSSNPNDHAHLTVAPKDITLEFAEAVRTETSTFKVYYYPLAVMMKGRRPMTGAQMDVFAGAAAKNVLALKIDTDDRVDTGLIQSTNQATKVVIGLENNLKPGIYVTAWEAAGADAEVETGFIHFHLENGRTHGAK